MLNPVITLREMESKVGGFRIAKGTICSYNEEMHAIAIPAGRGSGILMSAYLGKDVIKLEWIKVKQTTEEWI